MKITPITAISERFQTFFLTFRFFFHFTFQINVLLIIKANVTMENLKKSCFLKMPYFVDRNFSYILEFGYILPRSGK